jgi:hypothetical protein
MLPDDRGRNTHVAIGRGERAVMPPRGPGPHKFEEGDLLLQEPRDADRRLLPGIMMVCKVAGVGSKFYSLDDGFMAYRQSIERVDRSCIPIPPGIPWRLGDDFRLFRNCARTAYRSALWCIDEVGNPVGRNLEFLKDSILGKPVERRPEVVLRACGYSIRVYREGQPVHWTWTSTPLHGLRDLAVEAEADLPVSDLFLPDHLSEKQLLPWDYPPLPGASRELRRGDTFCTSRDNEICFSTFQRYTRSGKIATGGRGYTGIDPAEIRQVPTAFPPEIMAAIGSFSSWLSFSDSRIWAVCGHPSLEAADWLWNQVSDVPGALTDAAYGAVSKSTVALYYTNDRIHWWRQLSDVLNREIKRLRFTFKEGHSRPQ